MMIDAPRGPCPGDNTLAELIGGASTFDGDLPRHISQCSACQEIVADALRDAADEAPRYRIEDLVGTGGMGLVLRAFDVVLERSVALKILWGADERSIDAVLAEARTLARFAHPNIVTVHDAGVLEPQRAPFIAMELVEGPSLREWSVVQRSWQEVVEVFLGAAAGLAAAHEHEIVHADFKPANVLLDRDRGRVLVTDFGLARRRARESDETASGPTGGTPRYAAPELAQQPPDARSDQFAFGVALHEALFGRHPFRDDDCSAPGCKRVPPAFDRIVRRCVERDPSRRYASMADVIADLRAAAQTRRTWPWLVGGAAVVLAGAVAWSSMRSPCLDEAHARVDRWHTELRPVLASATDPDAWSGVAPLADDWIDTWHARAEASCRSAKPEPTMHACLQERWATLDALVERIADEEDPVPRDAVALAVAHLPDAEACRAGEEADAQMATAEEITAAATALARGRASMLLGRAVAADAALGEAIAISDAADLHGLDAEAHLVRAKARWHAGSADAAFDDFSRASDLAVRAGLPDLAAVATGSAAQYVAYYRRDAVLARRWLQQARALASRGDNPLTDLNLDRAEAWILSAEGDDAAAAELMQSVMDRLDDGKPLARATNAVDLGTMLGWAGEIERGLVEVDRGIELRERTLGAKHPEVAQALETKATLLARADRFDEAAALLQDVVDRQTETYGADSSRVATVRVSRATVLIDAGRIDEADAIVPRETKDPTLASVVRQLDARIALARGDAEASWAILQALLDESAGAGRFTERRLLGLQRDLGLTALARSDWAEAARWLDRALAHDVSIDDTTRGELHLARARAMAAGGACSVSAKQTAQRAIDAWTHKASAHALRRAAGAQAWLAECSNRP